MRTTMLNLALALTVTLGGCSQAMDSNAAAAVEPDGGPPFGVSVVASLNQPWSMAFLPDGRLLVTEKTGKLRIVTQDGRISEPLQGVPPVDSAGQGGLADVTLHPDFSRNQYVYLSYAEPGEDGLAGLAVGRGKLTEVGLEGFQVIWRQEPKVSGNGHFAGRILFGPGGFMYISSGERQKFTPAQDMTQNLGKIIRLTDTGGIPSDNPFYDEGRVKAQIWSSGHRNPLGMALDSEGALWVAEMGPKGGDELNLVLQGRDYGWPTVSNGNHYDGRLIPQHSSRPEFEVPKLSWTPVISPSSLLFYSGDKFPEWKGSAFIGGLSSKSLIRVAFDDVKPREADRFPMNARIRDVEQGPDGSIWILEDGQSGGRLVRLIPPAGI
ncbi:MAG: PQQ-dependent sugar dehydrogenase [Sphingomonadaceae bacterium]